MSMQIFGAIKRSMALLHVHPPKSLGNFHRFNLMNVMIVAFLIVATILTGMFFALEAETFDDYSSSIHASTSAGLGAFVILMIIIKTAEAYKLIELIEQQIQQRKFSLLLFVREKFPFKIYKSHCHKNFIYS